MAEQGAGRVVCVGGVLWETIFSVDEIPGRGVKLLPRDARQLASGMAPCAAATIARLGQPVELWSLVGDDANGSTCRASLAQEGIDVEHMRTVQGVGTPFSTILVDPNGERLIVPYFDPRLHVPRMGLPLDRIDDAKAVLVDVRWLEGSAAALRRARERGVPGVLDADLAPRSVLEQLLPLAGHVLFSEVALYSLVSGGSPQAALREVAAGLAQAEVVGVTLGQHGALIWQRHEPDALAHFPAHPVRPVDTLNAGDVWHGAYVYGLVNGMPMAPRVHFANVAAAIKCERPWGRLGAPRLAEVLSRLETPAPSMEHPHDPKEMT